MTNNLQEICKSISYEIYEIGDMANPHELNGAISSIDEAKNYFASYDFLKKYDLDRVADYYLVKKLIDLKSSTYIFLGCTVFLLNFCFISLYLIIFLV